MQRNSNQIQSNKVAKKSEKKLSVVIVTIALLIIALGVAVWISGNGTNGWIDVNADIGADKSNAEQLEAKSPVEFPEEPIVVTQSIEKDSAFDLPGNIDGTIEYVIKNVEIFDNLQDAGISYSELFDRFTSGDLNYQFYSADEKKTINMASNNLINGKTNQFIDDCYLLMFEVEITNVNAVYDVQDSRFNYLNTDIFRGTDLFTLYSYNETLGEYSHSNLVYVKENAEAETGVWGTVKLSKGQPAKLHIGFIVFDNSNNAFSEMGLKFCEKSIDYCDENGYIYWFNMSKMIEDYKNGRG